MFAALILTACGGTAQQQGAYAPANASYTKYCQDIDAFIQPNRDCPILVMLKEK